MQKWEYKKYFSSKAPAEDELNDWGEDGWELVIIIEDAPGKGFYTYFKRRVN